MKAAKAVLKNFILMVGEEKKIRSERVTEVW